MTAFGLGSLGAMMVFYALESRSTWWTLAFALACWSSALYGWLAGTWPFTLVESIWGLVALRRFVRARQRSVSPR
jgi:hypothetical protein